MIMSKYYCVKYLSKTGESEDRLLATSIWALKSMFKICFNIPEMTIEYGKEYN